MNEEQVIFAKELKAKGDAQGLYQFIRKYFLAQDPYALYFCSGISLPAWKESEEDFDRRRILLLTQSAEGGVAEAMYQLACCYLYGEGVVRDIEMARKFSQMAALAGSGEAGLLLQQKIFSPE